MAVVIASVYAVVTLALLVWLTRKVGAILATQQDLVASLEAIANAVAALAREIADLKVGAPVTQEQLDALNARAQEIVAQASAAL